MLRRPDSFCFCSLRDCYAEWPRCLPFPPQRLCHCQQSTWHNEWTSAVWVTEVGSVMKSLRPHPTSWLPFQSQDSPRLHIKFRPRSRSQILTPLTRFFENGVLGNRVCWAVGSGCTILPTWLKSACELLPLPALLLRLFLWSILDSLAQGRVCVLTAESCRNKGQKRGEGKQSVQIIHSQSGEIVHTRRLQITATQA